MADPEKLERFKVLVSDSVADGSFVKLTLGNYQGTEAGLKNIYVRKVLIKREGRLAFTYRYQTKDIVKNYVYEEGLRLLSSYLESGFLNCTCFTVANDIVLLNRPLKGYSLNLNKPSMATPLPLSHDKEKARLIAAVEKPYLTALRITDKDGVVFKNAQDKYKQINQYVALLDPLIRELPEAQIRKVADMGSGKGYLTFALYDYLVNVLKREATVTGVEYRQDLVDLCNRIAVDSGFGGLSFVQGTIEDYPAEGTDLLIALHACDTATDDAIAKGINAGAELIVVAPCCHKQIRREIEKGKADNALDFITRYGIFLERQAVMVTDGIRAMILEYFGYKTKVFEFISEANTPKNVLIVGSKLRGAGAKQSAITDKIKKTKDYFGIGYHHLEKLLGL
ncbi:Methyltransferase domain-containing protein [Pedobacter westerhofensis]|uniref:Methyltransferase domain-containing protein n=1 Tax=Pedobacter westerhofensis TaxID=425512 RepID=A0A521DCJ8_9SPHI|nr:SAM-dependent methyltransferase [Pedobacter westerhofensis]SMO69356.1 Methyltransferase domain-containing protein [Pedobacter westerhofensis]